MVGFPALIAAALALIACATVVGALHVLAVRLDERLRVERLRLEVKRIRRRYEQSLEEPAIEVDEAPPPEAAPAPTAGAIGHEPAQAERAAA